MEITYSFAYPYIFLFLLIILVCTFLWRVYKKKSITYVYPVVGQLIKKYGAYTHPYKKILCGVRVAILALLTILAGGLRKAEHRSNVEIEGIDIALVLDVSGSMMFDDLDDGNRTRIDVAKEEASNFIQLRDTDAIALVIFAYDALSLIPLTNDYELLQQSINDINLQILDAGATYLFTGMLTGINRLKRSKAKSKVIILLTDGEPSPGDADGQSVIAAAKELGIKVYTMGIGSEHPRLATDAYGRTFQARGVNKGLLAAIARETGGRYFNAQNREQMRDAYKEIDLLERNSRETDIFTRYQDIINPLAWAILALALLELLSATFFWFGV